MQTKELQIKLILLSLVFLLASIYNFSFGKPSGDPVTPGAPVRIGTLIIDANVTVVLVNNEKAILGVIGDNYFTKFLTFNKAGDTLTIGSAKKKDLKKATVYVPAGQIQNIRVNSEAHVRSLYALEVPRLDVTVNGQCKLAISSIGKINVSGTKAYLVDETTEVRRLVPVTY